MTAQSRLDPRYAVVAGACITQFVIIGLLFAYSIFFKSFEDEFGWTRETLSTAPALASVVMGMLASSGGYLGDRFGPRAVLAFTGLAHGVGFALISQVVEPWQLFVIFGLFIGLGMSTHDAVTLGTVARWFDKRRGIMTGVVKCGTALGQMLVPVAAALLIAGFGWRTAALILGVGGGIALLAGALLMKSPARVSATAVEGSAAIDFSWRMLTNSRVFWTLCAVQFLFLPCLLTVPLHLPVHGTDLGMGTAEAAGLLSVMAGASIVGRLTIGAFVDQIGGKRGFVLCFVPLIASLVAFVFIDAAWLLFFAVTVYGFAHGGLFTVVTPTIAEYFGTRAVGAIFGSIIFFGTIGGAIAPILAGRIFDVTGSYMFAFAGLAIMALLGLLLVLSLPRARGYGATGTPHEAVVG